MSIPTCILDECLNYLHKNLQNNYIVLRSRYYVPQDIYPKLKRKFKREKYLKELFENMLNYVGIPASMVQFKISNSTNEQKAGTFQKISTNSNEIILYYSPYYDVSNIISVLAHEISHLYLNMNSLKYPDTYRNEILTDVCAIYLGFGYFLLYGYKEKKFATFFGTYKEKIGYISKNDIEYISQKILQLQEKSKIDNEIEKEIKLKKEINELYFTNLKKIYKLKNIIGRTLILQEHHITIKSMFEELELQTKLNMFKLDTLSYDELLTLKNEMLYWKNILTYYIFDY